MNGVFFGILLLTALISSVAFILPRLEVFSDQVAFVLCAWVLIPQTAASWFFLTSLRAFKKELKIAYTLLAIGIFIFGLSQLQLPIVVFFTTFPPIAVSWYIVLTSLVGSMIFYFGLYRFARLLQVKSLFASPWVALGLAVLLAIGASFIPHLELPFKEITIDGIFGCYMAACGLSLAAAILALSLRKRLGPLYKASMGWLAAGLFAAALACVHETVIRLVPYFTTNLSFENYFIYGLTLWPYILSALLLLKSSLSFKATSKALGALPEDASYIDIVNYIAQKASDPASIDPALDEVRQITALLKPGDEVKPDDKAKLVKVYKQIEDYLVTKEPLRTYTREELRRGLPDKFQQELGGGAAPKTATQA